MTEDCKKALARIAKVGRENIAAFGPSRAPRGARGLKRANRQVHTHV